MFQPSDAPKTKGRSDANGTDASDTSTTASQTEANGFFNLTSDSNVPVPAALMDLMNDNTLNDNTTLPLVLPPTPEYLAQTFHPKTLGMRANKEEIQRQLQAHRPAENAVRTT